MGKKAILGINLLQKVAETCNVFNVSLHQLHDWIYLKDALLLDICKKTYSVNSVLHSHTEFMYLCPCGIYRQLNLIL